MAISYPLTMPSQMVFSAVQWSPVTKVTSSISPYTGVQQTQVYPGQWWTAQVTLPPMNEAKASFCVAWLLSLNGMQGTFYFGDPARKYSAGSVSGSMQVGAGAIANTTTLPLQGISGALAVGDWLTVWSGETNQPRLHKVVQVNSGSVDVFPRLRIAYTQGSAVGYSGAYGRFRLADNTMDWSVDVAKIYGLSFKIMEVL